MTNQAKAIVLLVLALVAAVLVVVVVAGGDDDGDKHDDQASQEVFTEPAAYAADPYTAPVTTEDPPKAPSTTAAPKGSTTTAPASVPGTAAVSSSRGGEPGLYGGTKDASSCDKEKLVSFLEDNPSKARAWAEVVGIAPSEIRTFVDRLTPVLLRADTRVTNHGYKNGRATTLQAVLQKGTAVLVDEYGRPIVKCYCGNPLTAPRPVQARYYGPRWDDFEPTRITVVVQNTTIINNFTLVDVDSGEQFGRPAGSSGDDDGPPPKKDTTGSSQPPTTTTEPEGTTTTAPPDEPMLTSEQLAGSWEFNADVAPGQPSTCTAYQGAFDMAISGSVGTRTFTWTFFGTQASPEPISGTVEPDNSFTIEHDENGLHEVITGDFLLEPPDLVFMSGKSKITGDGGSLCEFTFGGSKQ